tara:strand:+ start:790 stop:990 length:201 start_codon:yes stop_codon:yes gene_type:complete
MKKTEKQELINDFIEDYNSLLEGLNDELEGMGISPNKLITKFSQVKIDNVECCEKLTELYYEIINI